MASSTRTGLQDVGATETTLIVEEDSSPRSDDDTRRLQQRIEPRIREQLFSRPPLVTRIGRYAVLEELGRGGMGAVYAAYDEELDRKVAIKVLHPDELPTEERRLRFRREAQALARLSHPHVVTIHEVGTSEGQMYLAMEFIRGQSLAVWLRDDPPWTDVLDAFVQAGRGLAAAHQAELVHRDFKLLNVMRGEDGLVKVLDFGLVRELDGAPLGSGTASESHSDPISSPSGGTSSLTIPGRVMGTPSTMSPEQHRGEVVGPRSDQYSFCIAAWQGLSGSRPFSASTMDALIEAKHEGPPTWPSTAPPVPRRIVDALRRGLNPDPLDRWPSMHGLIEVLSRDPRRHRSRRWAGLAVVAAIALGGAGLQAWLQAREQRCSGAAAKLTGVWDEARRSEVEAAMLGVERSYAAEVWERTNRNLSAYADQWAATYTEACEATTIRGEQSAEVMDRSMACLQRSASELSATVDVLADADPTVVSKAHELTAKLVPLSRCRDVEALRARVMPPDDPDVVAEVEELRQRLQELRVQQEAGRYAAALESVESIVTRAEALGYAPLVAEARLRRGSLHGAAGHYGEAEEDLRRAYAVALEHRHDPVALDAVSTLTYVVGYEQMRHSEGRVWGQTALAHARRGRDAGELAEVLNQVGSVLATQGRYEHAEERFEHAIRLQSEILDDDDPRLIQSLSNLGNVLRELGRYEQAMAQYEQALRLSETALGPVHPEVAKVLLNMGNVAKDLGEYEAAQQRYEQALRIQREALGPDHPEVADSMSNLCVLHKIRSRLEQAKTCTEDAIRIKEEALGPDHPRITNELSNLGVVLFKLGDTQGAIRHLERSLRIEEASLGPDHPDVARTLINLGGMVRARGSYEQAQGHYERALRIFERELGPDHPDVAATLSNLGALLYQQAKDEEATPYLERALRLKEEALGPEHPDLATTLSPLGNVLAAQGRYEQAKAHHARALSILEASLGPESPRLAFRENDLGTALYHLGDREQARHHWERAVELWEAGYGPDYVYLAEPLCDLANLALDEGELPSARTLAERALSLSTGDGADPESLATIRFVLARALWPKRSERQRAHALAVQARDALAEDIGNEDHAQLRAEIDRWLTADEPRR